MAEVFKIEIPVEVTSKADLSRIRQVEAILKRTDEAARKLAGTSDAAFSKVESGASRASTALEKVESSADKMADAMEDAGSDSAEAAEKAEDALEGVGDAAKESGEKARSAFNGAGDELDKYSQRAQKSAREIYNSFKEKVKLTLEAVDRAAPVLQQIGAKLKSVTSKAWHVAVKMKDLVTAPFRALRNMIMNPITMTLSVAGISMGAGAFYQTFTDFTTGMSSVKALTGATDAEFVQLTETAKELGATTKYTASQAAEGMQYLGMAGWDTNQITAAMPGLLNLAAAGATDLGTAADIVSDVMTAMGMSAGRASEAADIFARTATKTNTTITMMGETLKYAAPIAHSFGLELYEVSALTGMMANAGIKGSAAGTALRSGLLAMASPAKDAQDAMRALGISFSNSDGTMKEMGEIVRDLTGAFAGLTQEQRLNYAEALFGKMGSSAWLGVINQGADAYNALANSIKNSKGAADEMSKTQMNNLAGDVTLLQSAVDGMKISIMDELNPYLRQGVQWATAQVPRLTELATNMLTGAISKAKELKSHIDDVFGSADMKNADTFSEKLFIAWDKIIAEPFNAWWEGDGKGMVLDIVGKIGSGFGEVIHGVVAGAFAAIKGEEIDFEGLNLTGIGKAGAEAAKEYLTSFAQSLNVGGLAAAMPGGLKAGLLGFMGLKVGGTGFGIAKDIGQLKAAFSGIAPVATTTTTKVSLMSTAFGGLKATLAAVPGWGWAAIAALAAVGIGIKLFKDKQEQERQQLLHMGDAVDEASARYVEAAQRASDVQTTLDAIQEIKLQMSTDQPANEATIAQIEEQIGGIEHQYIYLQAQLADELLTEEQKKQIEDQLAEVKNQKIELVAQMKNQGWNVGTVETIKSQWKQLDDGNAEIAKTLSVTTSLSPEEIASVTSSLETIYGLETTKQLMLTGYQTSATDISKMRADLTDIKANKSKIELKLEKGKENMTPQEWLDTVNKYTDLTEQERTIELMLKGSEMNAGEAQLVQNEIDALKKEAEEIVLKIIEAADSDLTQEELDQLLQKIQDMSDVDLTLGFALRTGSLNAEQIGDLNTQLEAYAKHLEEISGGMISAEEIMSGGVSDEVEQRINDRFQTDAAVAYNNLGAEVYAGRNKVDAAVEARAEYKSQMDAADAIVGNLKTAVDEADVLAGEVRKFWSEDSLNQEKVIHGELSNEGYNNWYAENASQYVGQGLLSQWNERVAPYLEGTGVTLDPDAIAGLEGGLVQQGINDTLSAMLAAYASSIETRGTAQENYNTQNDSLISQYMGERDYKTGAFTNETAYAGQNIEQLAAQYNALDEAGREMFNNAYNAVKELNEQTQYISEEEKTSAGSIMQTAYQSVEMEAKADLVDALKGKIGELADTYKTLGEEGKLEFDNTNLAAVKDVLDSFGLDTSQIESFSQAKEMLEMLGSVDLTQVDFSKAVSSMRNLSGQAETAQQKVNAAKSALEALDGQTATTYIHTMQTTTTTTTTTTEATTGHANGGLFSSAHVALVAEDGPEAIIPLGSKRRDRGLELWMEAGRVLGVSEFAQGGLLEPYAGVVSSLPESSWGDGGNGSNDVKPIMTGNNGGIGGSSVQVIVEANPTYEINGSDDPNAVMEIIRSRQGELAEMLGGQLASVMSDIFTNTI